MTFVGVLEAIGKGFAQGLKWAAEYAVPVERLVGLLFPAATPVMTEVADATTLIQNAVLLGWNSTSRRYKQGEYGLAETGTRRVLLAGR